MSIIVWLACVCIAAFFILPVDFLKNTIVLLFLEGKKLLDLLILLGLLPTKLNYFCRYS